jgi:hypothetical protein
LEEEEEEAEEALAAVAAEDAAGVAVDALGDAPAAFAVSPQTEAAAAAKAREC